MSLSVNSAAGNINARKSYPEFLSVDNTLQSEAIQYWPASVVVKSKKGNGLVIGGYTIGDAVSADLFGHPAIRY